MADTGSEFWRKAVEQVRDDDVVQVNMPYKHYLQECMLSCKRFELYQNTLAGGGMDFKRVSDIPDLIALCREFHSQATMVSFPNPASREAWEKGRDEAENLLYDIKAAMDYAFRDHPELLSQVSAIRQGSSNPDLIQDLSDASVLGKANAALLEEAKYDMANVDQAAELAKTLSELLAQATLDRSVSSGNTATRDKAFSLLKKTVDNLNKQARFIYRADKKTASEFVINPPRRKSSKKPDAAPVTA